MEAFLQFIDLMNDLFNPELLYDRADWIADSINSRLEDQYDAFRSYVVDDLRDGIWDRIVTVVPDDLPRFPIFDDDDEA